MDNSLHMLIAVRKNERNLISFHVKKECKETVKGHNYFYNTTLIKYSHFRIFASATSPPPPSR